MLIQHITRSHIIRTRAISRIRRLQTLRTARSRSQLPKNNLLSRSPNLTTRHLRRNQYTTNTRLINNRSHHHRQRIRTQLNTSHHNSLSQLRHTTTNHTITIQHKRQRNIQNNNHNIQIANSNNRVNSHINLHPSSHQQRNRTSHNNRRHRTVRRQFQSYNRHNTTTITQNTDNKNTVDKSTNNRNIITTYLTLGTSAGNLHTDTTNSPPITVDSGPTYV